MTKREKIGVARSISPFLVIDDNTIKASIIFAKIDKFNHLILIENKLIPLTLVWMLTSIQ